MAGAEYNPQDIRCEMGPASRVTTPHSTHETTRRYRYFSVVTDEPMPLESIALGQPGNDIDVKNILDFQVLNQAFLVLPQSRRSKWQAIYNPDLVPSKKFKGSSSTTSLMVHDYTSGVDSSDKDFELFRRPKAIPKSKDTSSCDENESSEFEEETGVTQETKGTTDDDLSLAQVLLRLKKEKSSKNVIKDINKHDVEMKHEFYENRSGNSASSAFDSVDYAAEKDDDQDNDENEADDVDTPVNLDLEDYDVSKSFSLHFYTELSVACQPLYAKCELIEETNVDIDVYGRKNLARFLKRQELFSTISVVTSF